MTRQGGGYAYAAATGPRRTVELRAYAAIAPPPVSTGTATRTTTLHALAAIEAEGFGVEVTATTALAAQAAIATNWTTDVLVNIHPCYSDLCILGGNIFAAGDNMLKRIDVATMTVTGTLASGSYMYYAPTLATDGTYVYMCGAWWDRRTWLHLWKVDPSALSIVAESPDPTNWLLWIAPYTSAPRVLADNSLADVYAVGAALTDLFAGTTSIRAYKFLKADCGLASTLDVPGDPRTRPSGATTDGTDLWYTCSHEDRVVKVSAPTLALAANVQDTVNYDGAGILTNDGTNGYLTASGGSDNRISKFLLSTCVASATATDSTNLDKPRGIVFNGTSVYVPTIDSDRVSKRAVSDLSHSASETTTHNIVGPVVHDGTYAYAIVVHSTAGEYYLQRFSP